MSDLTADTVRQFLLKKYSSTMTSMGLDPRQVPDDFDFAVSGVIDSFGILEMVGAVEDEFLIRLDLERLDAEQMTILGPFSQFVADNAIVE